RTLEVRGADMVPLPYLMALPALWKGLLYHRQARTAAFELTRAWSFARLLDFQAAVARQALRAPGALDLARELVKIARQGLEGEREFLEPLDGILDSGRTLAERALDALGQGPDSLIRFWQIA